MSSRILAVVAGVPPETLEDHSARARWIVYTIGLTLLFVTFPLAFLGMAVYASANLISNSWPTWLQHTVVFGSATVWALVVVIGVDRTLLVMSDAVDPSRKTGVVAMLAIRFALAFVLSSLVADEIILWRYRAPIEAAAQKLAVEDREVAARKLHGIHGIAEKQQSVTATQSSLDSLRAERSTLPAAIVDMQSVSARCAQARDALGQRVAALRVQANDDAALRPQLARLGQQLADKRRECTKLLTDAINAKAAYLREKDAAIAEASTQLKDATTVLARSQTNLSAEATRTGAVTTAAWQDGSSREAAFSRVKADRADIRHNAMILWLALLLLELLPMLIKLFARNNPVAAEAQEDLAAQCAEARMTAAQTAQMEALWATALAQSATDPDILQRVAAMQSVMEPLQAFEQILARSEAAQARLNRHVRRGGAPANAAAALLEAQANAFGRLAKAYP